MKRFLGRAVLGMLLIYGINQYLISQDISVYVGMNPISFLTSGILGFPGFFALYALALYRLL